MARKKQTSKLRPRHIFICCLVMLLLLGGAYLSQSSKMDEIAAEQDVKTAELNALMLEEEKLSRMLEYAQTDEYKRQYAREVLGYVGPNDFKFYREESTE